MHDPTNTKCKHLADRPKGFIKVKRQYKKIEDHGEFMHIANQSTTKIFKKHRKQSPDNTKIAIQTQSKHRGRLFSIAK